MAVAYMSVVTSQIRKLYLVNHIGKIVSLMTSWRKQRFPSHAVYRKTQMNYNECYIWKCNIKRLIVYDLKSGSISLKRSQDRNYKKKCLFNYSEVLFKWRAS